MNVNVYLTERGCVVSAVIVYCIMFDAYLPEMTKM